MQTLISVKNKKEQQISRGYLTKSAQSEFPDLSYNEKVNLLISKIPYERTLGARLLGYSEENKTIEYLIKALIVEKKLYSKIEICNSLVKFVKYSVKQLVDILGKIGNNQYKTVPVGDFKKDSYPLPRDIAARTLIRIGKPALPLLTELLESNNKIQLSEAIDAIGYICFYDYQADIFNRLKVCYLKFNKDELIKWKIIRAMSAFPESKYFLKEQKQILKNISITKEIERSQRLIHRNNK